MTGRPPGAADPVPADATGPTVVAHGLVKEYGEVAAVRGIDLEVRRGEFYGFLGPNGAGKTTTIRMLTGLARPTSGWIRVCGFDPVTQPLEVKRRIGVLTEEVQTYERLTGLELLSFSGAMHGLPRRETLHRANQLLELVDLSGSDAGRLIIDYSRGMKKKIGLASALIHGPEVLFLDEPLSGIDPLASVAIRRTLVRLTEQGVTIFFTSHVLEIVEKLCPRIALIQAGRILCEGSPADLARHAGLPPDVSLEDAFLRLLESPERADRPVDLAWYRSGR